MIRRQRIAKLRKEATYKDRRNLEALINRLRRGDRVLWDTDIDLLSRILDASQTSKRGAPTVLDKFHIWMAADCLHRRSRGKTADDAEQDVADDWGVSAKLVQKVVGQHREAACTFLAACDSDPTANLAIFMDAYRTLGRT